MHIPDAYFLAGIGKLDLFYVLFLTPRNDHSELWGFRFFPCVILYAAIAAYLN